MYINNIKTEIHELRFTNNSKSSACLINRDHSYPRYNTILVIQQIKYFEKHLENPRLISLQTSEIYKLEKFTKVENHKYFIKRAVEKSQDITGNKFVNSRHLQANSF